MNKFLMNLWDKNKKTKVEFELDWHVFNVMVG
jgi:hypothetical protein